MRIGIWNTAFLGDAALTLPLVCALRKALPDASLDLYVRRGVGQLFAAQPEINTVYEIGRPERSLSGMFRLGQSLAGRRYDLWISAHQSVRSSLLAAASKAPFRIGYAGAWHRLLAYTHLVDRKFGQLDEIERLLELLRPLPHLPLQQKLPSSSPSPVSAGSSVGSSVGSPIWPPIWPPVWPNAWPALTLDPAVRQEAATFRASMPAGPLLGIHPGSVWATKRWTPEGFATISRRAIEAGAGLALFAGPDEVEQAETVIRMAGLEGHPRVYNLAGNLSLPQLAAHLAVLDCYLSNDSGPMHLAWLQHVPVVALFGPTVRELGFFPRGERSIVLEAPPAPNGPDCRPCGLHGPQVCPRKDHACMHMITPDRVWDAVRMPLGL